MKFKIGDKVRYVREGMTENESEDWAKKNGCILGGVYTITDDDGDGWIAVNNFRWLMDSDHFELVKCKLNRK